MRTLALIMIAISLSGCAITQKTNPVVGITEKSVCLIENPDVKPGFLREYRSALESKGYLVNVIASSDATTACPLTSTYIGRWTWDLALYLSYADILVFRNGTLIGRALYDSTRGGARMDKFIDAESKIRELVNQLFPNAAGLETGAMFNPYPVDSVRHLSKSSMNAIESSCSFPISKNRT